MKSGKYTARSIAEKYLARIAAIDKSGPRVNSVIETNPDALRNCGSSGQGAKRKRAARAAARNSRADQGQHRDRGPHADDGGIAGAGGIEAAARCVHREEIARSGRGDSGKNESERVGEYPVEPFDQRMERARRADEKSVCAGSESVRIEFGNGRGSFRELRGDRNRNGDGWIDCVPVFGERTCGDQADGRAGEPKQDHSDFAYAGHGWTDVPHGARCGDSAGSAHGR